VLSSTPDHEEPAWYLTSSLDVRDKVFGRLLDLYMFGETYEVESFKISVMLTWQRFSYITRTYPCATVVRNVLGRLELSSGLVQYLIGCYAYYMDAEIAKSDRDGWNTLDSKFLTEVTIQAKERADYDDACAEPNHRWCEYHEHNERATQSECQSKEDRQDDPDVLYIAAKRAP
jgi:hypothetical protein